MKNTIKSALAFILQYAPERFKTYVKEITELTYWKINLRKSNNKFYNGHFKEYYTNLFDIEVEYFAGKKMLDIGCGPLGSLEWADDAAERFGADPLADKYIELNGGIQRMKYVKAGSEQLPFEDGYFDVVSIFNALDHVEDVTASVIEAERVLAPGGDLLLIVEINHKPTLTEPHFLTDSILQEFGNCEVRKRMDFAINDQHDVYGSITEGKAPRTAEDAGILCAHLTKRA